MTPAKSEETSRRGKWWVIRRHHDFTIVNQPETPTIEPKPGERGGRVFGPYATEERAREVKAKRYGRTFKGKQEKRVS